MTQLRYVVAIVVALLFFNESGALPSAQNMSGTVVDRRVQFARGSSRAQVRGKAAYARSYVYLVRAQKGQQLSVQINSGQGNPVTFSLVAPDAQTVANGFGVRQWFGELSQSGDYSIVVVMNEKKASAVEYKLAVSIR